MTFQPKKAGLTQILPSPFLTILPQIMDHKEIQKWKKMKLWKILGGQRWTQ